MLDVLAIIFQLSKALGHNKSDYRRRERENYVFCVYSYTLRTL